MTMTTTEGPTIASPLIGISSYSLRARWSTWDDVADLLPHRYVEMVVQAGGLPVLLPPTEHVADVLARLDGLILSGGSDRVTVPRRTLRPDLSFPPVTPRSWNSAVVR
jgi:hypothetical protein